MLQARLHASFAARAERRAASAALTQVEAGISYHAQLKNFDKLREVASASSIATKVTPLPPSPGARIAVAELVSWLWLRVVAQSLFKGI